MLSPKSWKEVVVSLALMLVAYAVLQVSLFYKESGPKDSRTRELKFNLTGKKDS